MVAMLILGACGNGADSPSPSPADTDPTTPATGGTSDPIRVAYFSFAADNTYSQAIFAGIEEALAESGGTADLIDGGFDATVQINAMQDALASGGYDAWVVSANDGNGVAPVVEDAIAQGIKVVATFTPIGPELTTLEPQVEGLTSTVGNPLVSNGEWFAQMAADACGDLDPCNFAFMPGLSTLPLDAVRVEAMQAKLEEFPNVNLVATVDGGYTSDAGFAATQDLLVAHPDVHVIGAVDQAAQGVELALQDAGMADQVQIFGNGGSAPGVEAVREGRWYATYLNFPNTEGKTAGELLLRSFAGETVPTFVNTEELSPTGSPIATEENVGDFEAEWEG